MILLMVNDILHSLLMIFFTLFDTLMSNLGRQRLYYASPWE